MGFGPRIWLHWLRARKYHRVRYTVVYGYATIHGEFRN